MTQRAQNAKDKAQNAVDKAQNIHDRNVFSRWIGSVAVVGLVGLTFYAVSIDRTGNEISDFQKGPKQVCERDPSSYACAIRTCIRAERIGFTTRFCQRTDVRKDIVRTDPTPTPDDILAPGVFPKVPGTQAAPKPDTPATKPSKPNPPAADPQPADDRPGVDVQTGDIPGVGKPSICTPPVGLNC